MRTAIVHDWLTGMRGGEKCLEVFCELFPDADLHTLIYRRGHLSPVIEQMKIRTSWIQNLPGNSVYYRHLLPLFPRALESFDFSAYDLVISSSHCVAKGAVTGEKTLHICYCYTPMRYAWDMYEHYFGSHRLRWPMKAVIPPLIGRLREWDRRTADRVDTYSAISAYVAERIRKYYGREATVIYPPVDLTAFSAADDHDDYYLMVNALAPYKRVDIAIEAFNKSGRELRIVGTGQDRERLAAMAGDNITFLGWVSREELAEQYRRCRAFIFPGEEDFGITPLEAMASGRPVIAFGRGGVTETVPAHPESPGGTGIAAGEPAGVFFDDPSPQGLLDALEFFERHEGDFDPDAARQAASPFGKERFRREVSAFISEELRRFRKEGSP